MPLPRLALAAGIGAEVSPPRFCNEYLRGDFKADDGAAAKLESLVEASGYDEAVKLAVDRHDLAARDNTAGVGSDERPKAMRRRQLRRRGFFDRWKRAKVVDR